MTTLHSTPSNRRTCLPSGLGDLTATVLYFPVILSVCFGFFLQFERAADVALSLVFRCSFVSSFQFSLLIKSSSCRQLYIGTQSSYTDVGVTHSTCVQAPYFRLIKMSVFSAVDMAGIFFQVCECWSLLFPSVLEHYFKSEAVLGRVLGCCFPVLFPDSNRYFLHSSA